MNRTMPCMKAAFSGLALFLALALSAGGAHAQQGKGRHGADGRSQQQMTQQDRQRMRDDMRDAYRDRDRDRARPDRQRSMSREDRDKLRRDVEDANKQIRR